EERHPFALPAVARAVADGALIEVVLRGDDALGAHQQPALLKAADRLITLAVMPREQRPQFLGNRQAKLCLELAEFDLVGTRAESLQVARTVFLQPVLQAVEQGRQLAALLGRFRRIFLGIFGVLTGLVAFLLARRLLEGRDRSRNLLGSWVFIRSHKEA